MTDLEQDRIDISDWFLLQDKRVQTNSRIVNIETAGPMYHIDKKTPTAFFCQLPRSAALSENNTTARITVSPNLIGCLIGYSRVENDFSNGTDSKITNKTNYKGGYLICELPYIHCIQPNEKLVYDANRSLEHWLITYNKNNINYKPINHGKMFISSITLNAKGGQEPTSLITVYIEHNKADGIKLSPNKLLGPGYHKVELFFPDNYSTRDCNKESDFIVKKCTPNEYQNAKNLAAALLSLENNSIPTYYKW